MKRRAVLKLIEREAKRQGIEFSTFERTNHTGIKVGNVNTVIGRHVEVSELARLRIFKQLEPALGKRWWQ